jgi:hypothetical protein
VKSKSGFNRAFPFFVAALLAEDWLLAQKQISGDETSDEIEVLF